MEICCHNYLVKPCKIFIFNLVRKFIRAAAIISFLLISLIPITCLSSIAFGAEISLTTEEQAWLEKKQTIRVRVTEFPPYSIPSEDGEPAGIAFDYLKLIAQRTGVKFEYYSSGKTFPQALNGLINHQGPDLIPIIVQTPDREESILFTKEYLNSPYMIFTRADSKQIITHIDDLLEKKIALLQGATLHKMMKRDYPDFSLMLYDTDIEAIEAVASGKVDAYMGNLMLTSYLILSRGTYNLKITAPSPFDNQRFSMGVRNDWPELANIIEKGLATITPQEQDEIRNRYISLRYEKLYTNTVIKWTLIILVVALSIILLFLFWNRSLKKQVTARTRELNFSVAQYRGIYESLQDGYLRVDLDGNILLCNKIAANMLGYELLRFKKMNMKQDIYFDPEDREKLKNDIINGQILTNTEINFKHKEGYKVIVEANIHPLFNNGKVDGLEGTFRDTTERKHAERMLRQSSLLLETTQRIARVGGWELDLTTNTLFWTAETYRIYDTSPEEFNPSVDVGVDYFLPESRRIISKALQEAMEEGKGYDLVLETLTTKGRRIDVRTTCTVTFHEGRPVKLTGIFQDITKKKQMEEQSTRLASTIDQSFDHIMITDTTGNLQYVNPAFERVTGYGFSEVVGKNPSILKSDKHDQKFYQNLWKTISTGNVWIGDLINKRKDGSFIEESATIFPIFDQNKKIINYAAVKRDKTDYHKLEERLRQAQKMESIGTLAGGIAHDFNNILSSIIGFTDLALGGVEKDTELEDDLNEVRNAGMRAKDLVKQILNFARQSDETVKPIRVSIVAKEVLKFIKSSIPTTIQIKDNIYSDSLMMGSPSQVYQIFMNLFTNAAQAMEENGGFLEITINDTIIDKLAFPDLKSGEYIEIKVTDSGIGIQSQHIHKIFEPYFTTKPMGEGTGLGLAVVHGIVESYGGLIKVDSKILKGTTFSIYLPVTKKLTSHRFSAKENLPLGNENILFVDDEAPIAKMGSRILEELGYSVTTRTSSIEALELFKIKPQAFDLLVTDMTMPNMTGDQLAGELMKIRPDMPVVLCTGYSKNISEESVVESGIKAFAYKPISKFDLAKTVRKVLDETNSSE